MIRGRWPVAGIQKTATGHRPPDGTQRPCPPGRMKTGMKQTPANPEIFKNLQSFYDANPARWRSPEADYGVH